MTKCYPIVQHLVSADGKPYVKTIIWETETHVDYILEYENETPIGYCGPKLIKVILMTEADADE
jgi:hypothetical protein